jgi:hypothetical protein
MPLAGAISDMRAANIVPLLRLAAAGLRACARLLQNLR